MGGFSRLSSPFQAWSVLDRSGRLIREVLIPVGFHVIAVEEGGVVGWTDGPREVASVRRLLSSR
jgi:hypothetical protein